MSKIVEIRKALGKILFNFSEIEVDGTIYVYETLVVGGEVFIYDEEGNKVSAGNVVFEIDNQVITVENGIIVSIEPKTTEETVVEELEEETPNELEVRVSQLEIQVAEILSILNSTVEVVEEFSKVENGTKIEKKTELKSETPKVKGALRYFN